MKIAFLASEVFPYAKTGGLGDVAGTLPKWLEELGHEVKVFLPKYNTFGEVEHNLHYLWNIKEIPVRVAGRVCSVHLHTAKLPNSNVDVYFIDCPQYFHRFRLYTSDPDEDERFILFMKGTIEALQHLQWSPDIIHCNDWQTGLIPLLIKENYGWDRLFENCATVFTIHNIAYQGIFAKEAFSKAEIKQEHYLHGGIGEFFGNVNFLKTAIYSADIINTVSDTYARELLTDEFGGGMQHFLSERKDSFFGILNGIDYSVWNPETDVFLPYNYSSSDLSGKLLNKKFLVEHINFPFNESIPLIGIVTRIVDQKGFDIIAAGIDQLIELPAQWAVLGSGEQRYEDLLKGISVKFPQKIYFYKGYNNEFAHLIEAAADIFLMPSKFEPCGLNQLYSLKYGTVPVVRKTGGLADTVQDWHESLAKGDETGTGFSFADYSSHALVNTLQRAINSFYNKTAWRKIQLNGMNKDFSWKRSAEKYVALYEKALKKRRS